MKEKKNFYHAVCYLSQTTRSHIRTTMSSFRCSLMSVSWLSQLLPWQRHSITISFSMAREHPIWKILSHNLFLKELNYWETKKVTTAFLTSLDQRTWNKYFLFYYKHKPLIRSIERVNFIGLGGMVGGRSGVTPNCLLSVKQTIFVSFDTWRANRFLCLYRHITPQGLTRFWICWILSPEISNKNDSDFFFYDFF